MADEIVGGAVMGQATVICTKGDTYLATQADPVTMTPTRLDGHQPCVAKRTIRAFKGGVVYASPDGLVMVDQSGGVGVVTEGLISRAQWQAYKPASMHAAVHDNRYFCWYDTGAERGGLIFDLTRGAMSLTRTDVYATAAYSDGRRDELFLALADGNVQVGRRRRALAMRRVSKRYLLERAQNIGAGQVLAAAYPVQFRLRATIETNAGPRDVQVVHTVRNGRPFRLPGNYRARAFEFTLEGTAAITEATVASTLATSRRSDHGNLTTLRPALRGPAGDRGRPAAGQPGRHARAGADPPDARHALRPGRADGRPRCHLGRPCREWHRHDARRRRQADPHQEPGRHLPAQHAAGGGRHPPAPTGFKATPGLGTVVLEWDKPNFAYFGYAEIFRGTTNNQAQAVSVGQTTGWVYADPWAAMAA